MTDSGNRLSALGRATGFGVTVAGIAVLAMMLIGAADIAGTMFRSPIPGALELIETLMVLVIFLALPETQLRGQHISVDLLYRHFPPAMKKSTSVASSVLCLVFYGAMAWQGWKLFWDSWLIREYAPGSVAFPIYPSKALFALGVTVLALVIAVEVIERTRSPSALWK